MKCNKITKNITLDTIYNEDCMVGLNRIPNDSVDLVLTDIPYGEVNRANSGIRNLDKGDADMVNFDLAELTQTLCDKTKGSIYMFCGFEQVSEIIKTMKEKGLSTRIITWEKTNPSPMNGQNLWLSATELCVYGKKKGAIFNGHCKSNVLHYPTQRGKIHPTMKPVKLFEELITTSSNEGDLVLDTFMGSGTTAIACMNTNRRYVGFELNKEFYDKANERINNHMVPKQDTLIENKNKEDMEYSIISKVQNNYPSITENVCGIAFIQKVDEFYNVIGKVNNSKAGLLFMKDIALGLGVTWSVMVEYLYYLVKEKHPSLYEQYEYKLDYQYVCQNLGGVFGKLLYKKCNSVFANKYMFDAVVANTGASAEDWLYPFILEQYGWDKVMWDIVVMYNQYMAEESRFKEVSEEEDFADAAVLAVEEEPLEDTTLDVKSVEEVEKEEPKATPTIAVVTSKKTITKKAVKGARGKAVIAHCLNDDTNQRFNTVADASMALHIPMGDIRKNIKGHTAHTGKGKGVKHYVFSYETPKVAKGKVLQIDPTTKNVVAEFSTVVEAEREYGFKPTRLNGVLKTVNKLCEGYKWMYEKEYKGKYPSKEYSMVA